MTNATINIGDRIARLPPMKTISSILLLAIINLVALYLVVILYSQQQISFALMVVILVGSGSYIFYSRRAYAHRYVFPAVAGMGLFVVFPLLYTVGIGFTNYSASNLLDENKVLEYHLAQTYLESNTRHDFRLFKYADRYQVQVIAYDKSYVSDVDLENASLADQKEVQLVESLPDEVTPLGIRDIIRFKKPLGNLTFVMPSGEALSMIGLRHVSEQKPLYSLNEDSSLTNNKSGEKLFLNRDVGFYQTADGESVPPGFKVNIGPSNFYRVLTDDSIRGPFVQIFVWTLIFSAGTVLFTLIVGLVLANVLQWDLIAAKSTYRTLLILPYAVPAFISILVFKGLFNQNFGEINLVLESLLGISPDWFSDPNMARAMILIVNTWLGYPYMMLLCMGLLQAIPKDLYEASAIDGATPIDNLLKITLPLIIKPLTPLLIASFAFNFNNFVLISLLTGGSPDIIGASTPAGTTDLLVSYTYRIAFQDSGQDFGLAAAIATIIFLIVGGMALLKLRLSKMEM